MPNFNMESIFTKYIVCFFILKDEDEIIDDDDTKDENEKTKHVNESKRKNCSCFPYFNLKIKF